MNFNIGDQVVIKYENVKIVSYNKISHSFILSFDTTVTSSGFWIHKKTDDTYNHNFLSFPASANPFSLGLYAPKFTPPDYSLKEDQDGRWHKIIGGKKYIMDVPDTFSKDGIYYLRDIHNINNVLRKAQESELPEELARLVSTSGFMDSNMDGQLFRGTLVRVFEQYLNSPPAIRENSIRYFKGHIPDPTKVNLIGVVQSSNMVQWHCPLLHLNN